jgi:hypothetical protein
MPQFTEFPEAVNPEKIFEIVQEDTLKTFKPECLA